MLGGCGANSTPYARDPPQWPGWLEGETATAVDHRSRSPLSELPYEALTQLVLIEAAAAFSELTLTNRDDQSRLVCEAVADVDHRHAEHDED